MKVLELFSGTGSVSKVCNELGFEVISLDLHNADINCDILKWDYTKYNVGEFDIIWGSPPCATFSHLTNSNIGKIIRNELYTKELMEKREREIGLVLLEKTKEIINYFKPTYYFIENPQSSRMKKYMDYPYYDVDYCMYSNWGYRKRTRIWTNLKGFEPKKCDKNCGNMIGNTHKTRIGNGNHGLNLNQKYRIPHELIKQLFFSIKIKN